MFKWNYKQVYSPYQEYFITAAIGLILLIVFYVLKLFIGPRLSYSRRNSTNQGTNVDAARTTKKSIHSRVDITGKPLIYSQHRLLTVGEQSADI